MAQIPFISAGYTGRSTKFESSRMVNLYLEMASDPDSKGPACLVGTPGISFLCSAGLSPVRGFHVFGGVWYAVAGSQFYSVSSAGDVAVLGTISTDTGRVSMADNGILSNGIGGNQLMIVDGSAGYIYNSATGAFQQLKSFDAVQATATITSASDAISSVTLTDPGTIYTPTPTALITDPTGTGATLSVDVAYGIKNVKLLNPVATTGSLPVITITSPTGSGAAVYPIVDRSSLIGFAIGAAGHGYTFSGSQLVGSITVTNAPGYVIASIEPDPATAEITGVTVVTGGSGYTSPTVVFDDEVLGAAATANTSFTISSINVVQSGSGYIAPPFIAVHGSDGKTTATATVLNSSITAITFTGGKGYSTIPTISISAPEGTTFPDNPTYVAYIDGYFVVTNSTMNHHVSELYQGVLWNTLATGPVQSAPDSIRAVVNHQQLLWFIKEYTIEIFYDSGTPTSQGSPFARQPGAVIDYGTTSPWSVCRGANRLFFLANERTDKGPVFVGVAETNGYAPQIISPPAITYQMSIWTDLVNAFAYSYSDGGHTFVVFTSPGDNQTFVYDTTTQTWHERSSYTGAEYPVGRHLSNCYASFNGKHYVGDYSSGNIYEMSSQFYSDNGNPIVSIRIAPHIADKSSLDDVHISRLVIDAETGVGTLEPNIPAIAHAVVNESGGIDSIVIDNHGNDYIAPPLISLSGDGGSGADLVPVVVNGQLQSVTVADPGTGYALPVVGISGPGITPNAVLSWSNDGGRTWSNDYPASMGNAGEYSTQLVWRRLGRARDRVFRLMCSDPVKKVFIGCALEIN